MTSPRNIVGMTAGAIGGHNYVNYNMTLPPEYSQDDGKCQLVYVMLGRSTLQYDLAPNIVRMTAGANWCT